MKEQATRLRGWMRHHRLWSSIILLALLASMGVGVFWTVNLVRFGWSPPTGQNCGSINHSEWDNVQTTRADATLPPLTCFWRAYQTCQAATISQTLAGTDAGHTDTLTIEWRNNRCAIYGHQDYWVNFDKGSGTYLCTLLSKEEDNLQVSACDGADSLTLFSRDPTRESYGCGLVSAAFADVEWIAWKAENCFFAAYQQCLADALEYRTEMNGVPTEFDFYIDNHCGIAYSRGFVGNPQPEAKMAACASLVMHDDGLHFSQCGTDGDIFVPIDTSSS